MGDLLGSLAQGSQNADNIVCHWGEMLQMVSKPLPNLRWGERAQAHKGCQRGRWVLKGRL
jgi:hypothetical protein